jgi:hypothetical protein
MVNIKWMRGMGNVKARDHGICMMDWENIIVGSDLQKQQAPHPDLVTDAYALFYRYKITAWNGWCLTPLVSSNFHRKSATNYTCTWKSPCITMPQRWNIMLSFAPDSEVKNETLFPKSKYCFPSKRDTKRIQGCFFGCLTPLVSSNFHRKSATNYTCTWKSATPYWVFFSSSFNIPHSSHSLDIYHNLLFYIAFRVKEIQKEYKDVFLVDPLTHLPNKQKKVWNGL